MTEIMRSRWLGGVVVLVVLVGFVYLLFGSSDDGPSNAYSVKVERVVSPGGIEAWLVRDRTVPVTAIEFSFHGGSALDPKGKEGLANLVSGLLDEGAGEIDSQTFQAQLADLSIRLSFSVGRDTFRGSLKTLNRNRGEAVKLLALALTAPRFDPAPVERVRLQVLSGIIRQSTDPNFIAGRTWSTAVYAAHPYSRPAEGTSGSVKAITADDLTAFVRGRFARDRLIVGVVGDLTPDDLKPILDEAFGALPENGDFKELPKAKMAAGGETFVIEKDVPQSTIVFGQPGVFRDDPDYYAAYVMNYVLGGGGFSSRLYSEVREKRGLAYSVASYLNPMRLAATIGGGAGTANANVAESLKLIRAEWEKMRDDGIDEDELEQAKTYLTGSFPLRLSSTDRIARLLVAMQYHDLAIDYIDRRAGLIGAVTRDDVARVAKKILDPKGLTVVVVGKPKDVEATAPAPKI